jgi:hypothetical protein
LKNSPLAGALAIAALLQAGCAMKNAVTTVPPGTQQVAEGHSILVIGVGLEAQWDAPMFSVQLDEYDVAKQASAGNCWRYNRALAIVPSEPGVVRHVAFDVPAGHYAFSGFGAGRGLEGGPQAFAAPSGQVVHVGDFIYAPSGYLVLRRNLEAARASLASTSPELAKRISPASATTIKAPVGILCTP